MKIQVAKKSKRTSKKKTGSARNKKHPLTRKELEYFRELLLEKRRELLRNVNEMEDETLKKSHLDATGDLSSMPIHMADLGTDNYEQEFALDLLDGERKLLTEIDEALQRIEIGTYGICQGTSKPIGKSRLEAQPWARFCVEYARVLEQGQAGQD